MCAQLAKPPLDRLVRELAASQHGVVSWSQLLELGHTRTAISVRVRAGWLVRIHRGVYAVGHDLLTAEGRFMAAVLACGQGTALSHGSAAALWQLRRLRGLRVDVTVPSGGGGRRHKLVIVHRSSLDPEDVTIKDGILVTTPARTVLDLADISSERELERTIDEAAYLGLDLAHLKPLSGRRGSGRLARVLARHDPGSTFTRSDLEERMLELCRRHLLPSPRLNTPVDGHEVDFCWPEKRLIVETDGFRAHGRRAAFERDRWRDTQLTAAGWRVVRITHRQLQQRTDELAKRLAALLYGPAELSAHRACP
jgi:very-short-patch-repair endonuclease